MSLPFVYGRQIRLHIDGGRMIRPRGVMVFDPSGKYWPKCSLLIMPIGRTVRAASKDEYQGLPRNYLGRGHIARVASVEIPSRDGWRLVGELHRIDYVRGGTRAPGGYRHHMNKPRGIYRVTHLLKGGKIPVMVSKLGNAYRIDLPSGCVVDDRGIVYP